MITITMAGNPYTTITNNITLLYVCVIAQK